MQPTKILRDVTLLGLASSALPAGFSVQDVAAHVIYSYPGVEPPPHLFDLIRQGKVGGIIIFGENVNETLSDTIKLFQDAYQDGTGKSGFPLLTMTDQEGGKVRRLEGGPELSAKQVGQSADPGATAETTGKEAGNVLRQNNLNTNLAPVVDVFQAPGNFVDEYGRSYSNSGMVVADCAERFIEGASNEQVLSVAKHFPGLGAAASGQNTDEEPVTINSDRDTLEQVDMKPYHQLISNNISMIMCSWAVYPAVDPDLPAGLSSKWVKNTLRDQLGFKGVTITDAIEAGALHSFGNDAQRGVLAARAGMDLLLAAARNVTQGEAIVDALVNALEVGYLDSTEFNAATERIMGLRGTLARGSLRM
ncbi:glycoside hydrolase superfamily [Aspergillus floccosus]